MVLLLSLGFGSEELVVTEAKLIKMADVLVAGIKEEDGFTTNVSVASCPLVNVPRLETILVPSTITVPWGSESESKLTLVEKKELVMTTSKAVSGPWFVMVTVLVKPRPAKTELVGSTVFNSKLATG